MSNNKREPKDGWRQLDFKTIICVPSPLCAASFFCILFIFSLILTSIILSFTYKIFDKTASITYYNANLPGDFLSGSAEFTLSKSDVDKISGPLYIYLEISDYYQNHRIYLKSRSKNQLAGNSDSAISTNCEPLVKYKDLDKLIPQKNHSLDDNIVPCGLMPASFLNVSLEIFINKRTVSIDDSDISWKTDDSSKYEESSDQYLDITDEHFKVWMRNSPTNKLRKLYGKIAADDIKDGEYLIIYHERTNIFKYISDKSLILSTTTRIGGKNKVLGWTFLVISVISLIWSFFFLILANTSRVEKESSN